MLAAWGAEPDPAGPLGPEDRVGLSQVLDTVLSQNPGPAPAQGRTQC